MQNSTLPPEPPPSISAAELRRRLLASTPPPLNGSATGTVDLDPMDTDKPGSGPISREDLLRKLKVPTGAAPAPALDVPAEPPPSSFQSKMAAFGRRNGVGYTPGYGMDPNDTPSAEVQRLKSENKELKHLLGEMKTLLQEASEAEQGFTKSKEEFAAQLADKQTQIDALSEQLHSIEEQISNGTLATVQPQIVPKTRSELEEWTEELEKESSALTQERRRIEEDRQQLEEDEEALEKQMREMEVSMARERALLARQETELKRLSAEIQHELEIMNRGDATLRDQMQKFQRRAQEVLEKPSPTKTSGTFGWGRRG
jgi:predicted  nucleic acid-binding Zn-ribbon protein